jgi:hypothetical protein
VKTVFRKSIVKTVEYHVGGYWNNPVKLASNYAKVATIKLAFGLCLDIPANGDDNVGTMAPFHSERMDIREFFLKHLKCLSSSAHKSEFK